MTKTSFKKSLQSELNANAISFRNPIKEVTDIGVNTCIVFSYPVDDNTKQWLNNRFKHGVSDTNTDGRLIFINTPIESNKSE